MSAPNSGHSGDEPLNDRDEAFERERNVLIRSPYAKMLAEYQYILAEGLAKQPLDRKQAKAMAHAQQDFEDALFKLQHRSGFGTVILDPADRRTEHSRVTNAIVCLHDWLRLYQEILRQPPPEKLQEIEQDLWFRLNEINRLYKPKVLQGD